MLKSHNSGSAEGISVISKKKIWIWDHLSLSELYKTFKKSKYHNVKGFPRPPHVCCSSQGVCVCVCGIARGMLPAVVVGLVPAFLPPAGERHRSIPALVYQTDT